MRGYSLFRLVVTIAAALIVAAGVYITHPNWFRYQSIYTLPAAQATPTAGGSAPAPSPTPRPRPRPTATVPTVHMTQHLDNVWITPYRVVHSRGDADMTPNQSDTFLVVYLHIENRSQVDYAVRTGVFQVLDSHRALDPPLSESFTHMRLREVHLAPQGYINGALVFEVPAQGEPVRLIYQPDPLDPTKQKVWVLR
jgi:hypothetical protein